MQALAQGGMGNEIWSHLGCIVFTATLTTTLKSRPTSAACGAIVRCVPYSNGEGSTANYARNYANHYAYYCYGAMYDMLALP